MNIRASFFATVAGFAGGVFASFGARLVVLQVLGDVRNHGLMQLLVILFQSQHVVRFLFDNLTSDLFLSPQRIDRDDRAFDIHEP